MSDLSPDVERELAALDDALAGRRVASDLTELGELALLLRDERPEPDDGFARSLDHQAAHGFPKGDPRRRSSGRRWFAWHDWMGPGLAGALAVGVAAFVIALPSGGEDAAETINAQRAAPVPEASDSAGSSAGAAADSDGGSGSAESLAEPQSVAPAPGPGAPRTDGRENRKVERSASITLAARPRNIDGVSARIQDVTRQQGGFVVSSSVSASQRGGGGEFLLRIPTRNLDAAMAGLSRLAAVRERAQRSQDITAEAVSSRTRLKDARTERKSLLEQLEDATTPQATASIRARLDLVSREIEAARADVRRVNNRAAFSTVAVTLVADRAAAAPGSEEDDGAWTPADAWDDALRVLEVVAGVALIVLAIAIPLALIALPMGLALRAGRRRRREHALDAV